MLSRALICLAAAVSLLASLSGCTSLTRPEEVTIQAEPVGAPRPQQGAAADDNGTLPKQVQPVRQAPPQAPAGGCGE